MCASLQTRPSVRTSARSSREGEHGSESGQIHALALRSERSAETHASRTRGRHARAHVDWAPRGRSEDARGRRGGALHAPARDARKIERSSRSWPRRKSPRPENAIKTRAAVRPCVFEAFQVDRAEVKSLAAPERRRTPGPNVPAEVPRPSPLGWTLPTRRTAADEFLQLLGQLLNALERTRLVIRHPNLLKTLTAPWGS